MPSLLPIPVLWYRLNSNLAVVALLLQLVAVEADAAKALGGDSPGFKHLQKKS